ncbi:solute carrier organic anion transporter family member 4A1-like [Antedon mediterranea]|uniref:solute carrier organic anion transporter family member 4A1-like n=1 Tax=Antedon mediterranea TaxID=105859 RepID=UPI003AF52362
MDDTSKVESEASGVSSNEASKTDQCGWRSCTPDNIQRFASPRWLLFVICIFVFIQNMVTNGFVNVSITTLERRFDLSSSQAALISGGYDVAAGLGVVPVSYYCSNRHKGKALTAGLILYGFGSLLFASPHFFAPSYNYQDTVNSSSSFCSVSSDETDDLCDPDDAGDSSSLSNYIYIFILAQLAMGLAATPIYTIGVAYLDENVKHKVVGEYLGIFLMMAILAAAIGFIIGGAILDALYVNFITEGSPVNVDKDDDAWIGAWWLAFVVSAFVSFLAAIPMSCFRAYLPGYEDKIKEKLQASQMTNGNTDEPIVVSRTDFGKWKDLPLATWQLLKNSTYLFVSLGNCSQAIILNGIIVFMPKFLEVIYLLNAGTAATLTGLFGTTFGALSTFAAGWAVRKWKMDIYKMLKMIIISTAVASVVMFSFFLKCPEPPLVGVSEPYNVSFTNDVKLNAQCNEQCHCSVTSYNAVCGSDGRVYFDACHAGCTVYIEESKTYGNCTCVFSEDNDELGSASDAACDTMTCTNLYIFLVLFSVAVTCFFLPGPSIDNITLRCVPHQKRSLALAVQWVLIRCLGTIPGPFLIGSLFDVSCILWNRTCDGSRGRCHRYDHPQLGVLFVVCTVGFSVFAILLYGLAYFSHTKKESRQMEQTSEMLTKIDTHIYSNYEM